MARRDVCEECEHELVPGDVAFACWYECTFCRECASGVLFICPNCQGELLRRPRRGACTELPSVRA